MSDELIAQVKAWVADPTKAPHLHDLLHSEAGRIVARLRAGEFAAGMPYADEELERRLTAYEEFAGELARSVALGAYWGHPALRPLWPGLIGRLANSLEQSGGLEIWLKLTLYPALLVFYSGGIAAVAARRDDTLAALFSEPAVREHDHWQPACLSLYPQSIVDYDVARRHPELARHYTPVSDRLVAVIRPWLGNLVPLDADFELQFDRFEFLLGLVHYDMDESAGHKWAPVGRFSWRRKHPDVTAEIGAEIERSGTGWPLLAQGLFGGSFDRLARSMEGFAGLVAAVRARHRPDTLPS